LSFKPQGKQFAVEKVWASNGPKSVMRNGWQTSLPLDGYLYGYDNVGAAGPVMHLNCVEMATGKLAWQQLRFGKGNCIAADGKLFCSSMEGELIVVRVSPKAYDEIGRATVFGTDSRQAPALANGLLYLRDSREILCFDVRE
jgi:outer membrane protein assembly factor BamB